MKRSICAMIVLASALCASEGFSQEESKPLVTFVPTGALSINTMFSDSPSDDIAAEDTGYFYPSLWLGVRAIAGPDLDRWWAPFASLGLEVEPHALWDGRSATYYIPTLRVGAAMVPDADWGLEDWRNPTYVPLHVYGSVGARSRSLTNQAALRLGVGLNMLMMPFGMGFTWELEQDEAPRWGVNLSMGF